MRWLIIICDVIADPTMQVSTPQQMEGMVLNNKNWHIQLKKQVNKKTVEKLLKVGKSHHFRLAIHACLLRKLRR